MSYRQRNNSNIHRFLLALLSALVLGVNTAEAQESQKGDYPGSDTSWELGAHAGRLLPNQIV